jgi:hypothetical protein
VYRHFSEPTTRKTTANDPQSARRPKRHQGREPTRPEQPKPQKTDSHLDGPMETKSPLAMQQKANTAGPFAPKRLPICRADRCQCGGHPTILASVKND